MDNNQTNQFSKVNPLGKGGFADKKLFELIALGCSCLGCLLSFIFTIVTCSRGPKASFSKNSDGYTMSLWIIGVIIAAIIAIAGIVFAILSKEKEQKLGMMAMIAIAVSAVALIFAIIPNVTICSYNCCLNDEIKRSVTSMFY